MRKATVIKVELDKGIRIERLLLEYANFDEQHLENCILRIGKRLGGQNVQSAIESLKNGDLRTVADITLAYYDKSYNFGLNQRNKESVHSIQFDSDDPEKNAQKLIEFAKKYI
jgi:tRNA 2-selenouridine synthase